MGNFLFAVLILISAQAFADGLETSCIGPANAQRFMVYLHGMDTPTPSQQELSNRAILQNIASKLGILIAVPRSQFVCPTQSNLICWGWRFDQNELATVLPPIMAARTNCFSADKPFELLGFSNGGYLITHWYASGLLPAQIVQPAAMSAVGSDIGSVASGINLKFNPPLTIVIGTADQYNYDPKAVLFNGLRQAGANVNLITFPGGHQLDQNSLSQALAK